MSKKFRDKTCVYCGIAGISEVREHVFARQFFLEQHWPGLPEVPACRACNTLKSQLENYLMTALGLGGWHPDAAINMQINLPRRLARNARLKRELFASMTPALLRIRSGLIVRTATVAFDADMLEQWCQMVVRGLCWHHWQTILDDSCHFDFMVPTSVHDANFGRVLALDPEPAEANLGNGTIIYKGVRSDEIPQATAWRFQVYGLVIGGEGSQTANSIGMITLPMPIRMQAEREADLFNRWRAGRGGR